MQNAKRVLKNTGFLYVKIVLTIFIALYSTRLILIALGEVDFGIFNLVGGVIGMLSFINGAMIIATQRYMSIAMGSGDMQKMKSVFNSSVVLHLIISLIMIVVLEIAGAFMFEGGLNIPPERIHTAKFIFHFMIVSTFFTINAVPYDAAINSHENMLLDAILGVFEALMKLGIAIWLTHVNTDKLIFYGIMIASLTVLIRVIKSIYCHRYYEECTINIRANLQFSLLKEMLFFAGWSVFGLFCSVLKNQGLAILLNLFFGIVVNAAYGIANQVNSNIKLFSTNMVRAIMPQITKSEGSGDHDRMLRLSIFASKISFFLLAFFAVPIIVEMHFVLKIWLKTVPENSVLFCQLILVVSLLYQITIGTMTSVTSVGDIKAFQIAVGAIEIFSIPISFGLIKLGLPAYSVFVGAIFLEIVAGAMRTWYANKKAGLGIYDFVIKTWLYSFICVILAFALATGITFLVPEGFIRAGLILFTTTVGIALGVRYIVLTTEEVTKIKEIARSYLSKYRFIQG